jgi:hypothetical protein
MVMTGYTTRIVVVFSAEKFQDESLPSCLAISKKEKRKKNVWHILIKSTRVKVAETGLLRICIAL